jgi:feruloyl esterase
MRRLAPVLSAAAFGLTFVSIAAPAAAQPRGPAPAPRVTVADPACAALAAPGLFKDMTVSSAEGVQLGAGSYCEVTGTVSPVPGSKIGVVYRLPKDWNGRVVGYGGGGWAGNVALQTVRNDLERGYATMQTDGGHASLAAFDAGWTAPNGKPDLIALTDFSWRGVHQMTVTGKDVAAKYYGKPEDKAVFVGCSTGGRMALMEAQRFPGDYDGIVAGAPVYSLRVQLAEIYRDVVFARAGGFNQNELDYVNSKVLADCDAQDGVKDGVLGDPAACRFNPDSLKCRDNQITGCMVDAQANALKALYSEAKGKDGVVYAYPYSKGSEVAWPSFQNTTANPEEATKARDLALRAIMFGDPNFSFKTFDIYRDGPKARATAFAKDYEADDPNLQPFLSKGGKLILWHGLSDQGPSPWGTVAYDQRMQAATGAALAGADTRMFLAPGVLHCGGGPGPSQMDWLAAMDGWIKTGAAPETILASTPPARPGAPAPAPATMVTRPLCAYPAKARYDGKGDPNVAASFSCK